MPKPHEDKTEVEPKVAELNNLINHLHFAPEEGRIWFETHALAMIRPSNLSALHREMIEKLGPREAGSFLANIGYESGTRDATLARELHPDATLDEAFQVGPKLRAIRGIVTIRPIKQEIELDKGHFYSEAIFSGDFEVDTRLAEEGMAKSPVCWMQVGYASGYASALLGQPVIYKEVECRASGSNTCRVIGKLLKEWYADEISEELANLPIAGDADHFPMPRKSGYRVRPYVQFDFETPIETHRGLVGASPAFKATCQLMRKVAGTTATVLLLGETGVGKEKFARTLHDLSARSERPFVALNCAAIPDNLIEAELFGVEKGAFTGATQSRPGRFERAEGGTLFLDEIGNLTRSAQTKLLRAIQEKETERVGGSSTQNTDVRIIAATNEDLQNAVKSGEFREDLLFRINVFPINIPPLRERREDIPLLMSYFLNRYTTLHKKQIPGFTEIAIEALYRYNYPGNIRELENLIERTVILAENNQAIDLCHLFSVEGLIAAIVTDSGDHHSHSSGTEEETNSSLYSTIMDDIIAQGTGLEEMKHQLLESALAKTDGNLAEAARMLGISRPQMAYRLKKYTGQRG